MKVNIDQWYDKSSRSWVTQLKDEAGNQIGEAAYDGNKVSAAFTLSAFKVRQGKFLALPILEEQIELVTAESLQADQEWERAVLKHQQLRDEWVRMEAATEAAKKDALDVANRLRMLKKAHAELESTVAGYKA